MTVCVKITLCLLALTRGHNKPNGRAGPNCASATGGGVVVGGSSSSSSGGGGGSDDGAKDRSASQRCVCFDNDNNRSQTKQTGARPLGACRSNPINGRIVLT